MGPRARARGAGKGRTRGAWCMLVWGQSVGQWGCRVEQARHGIKRVPASTTSCGVVVETVTVRLASVTFQSAERRRRKPCASKTGLR